MEKVLRPLLGMMKSFKTALFAVLAKLEVDLRFDIALRDMHDYAAKIIDHPSLSTATDPGSSLRAGKNDAGFTL